MNRPPLLLSRYLSCISCINHVYILTDSDRDHIILYITIPVVQYIFLSRLCHVYARDILYRLCTVIIIIIIAIQILYLGPVVVNHIFYRGRKSIRERERERQSSQSARMKPILTVYHYELDIPLNHVCYEETRSVKQSSKFRPNFPPLSRVFFPPYI